MRGGSPSVAGQWWGGTLAAAMQSPQVLSTPRPRFNWSAYGVERDPVGKSARGDDARVLDFGAAGLARPNVVAAEGCSMNVRRSRFLIPVLVLMLGAMALVACGESDGPDTARHHRRLGYRVPGRGGLPGVLGAMARSG